MEIIKMYENSSAFSSFVVVKDRPSRVVSSGTKGSDPEHVVFSLFLIGLRRLSQFFHCFFGVYQNPLLTDAITLIPPFQQVAMK
jgi:hypothetical protein